MNSLGFKGLLQLVCEHCCRENELTFPVGVLRVAVSYGDRRNYQSGRGASVRKVQYTRKVSP